MHSTSLPNLHTQPCSDHPKATRDTPPTVREFKGRSRFHSLSLLANHLSSRGSPFHSSNPDGRCVCARARNDLTLCVNRCNYIDQAKTPHSDNVQTPANTLQVTETLHTKYSTTKYSTRLPTQEYHLMLDDHVAVVRGGEGREIFVNA